MTTTDRPARRDSALRLAVSASAGVAAGLLVGLLGLDRALFGDESPVVSVCAGWSVGALVFMGLCIHHLWPLDGPATRAWATREDPSVGWSRAVGVAAAGAALVGVVGLMARSHAGGGASALPLAILAILTVASAWFVIHTLYALRYAEDYFTQEAEGDAGWRHGAAAGAGEASPGQAGDARPRPIEFSGSPIPTYSDFAYFSFNLGLTFQVSDTDVGSMRLRRTILVHCILSYLYSTAILASVVNLVIGML
ncbi:DUF1345 domain-containing protein [Falsarthrobacter nasiphocae]|uniref:Membrane protein n=1 Tax=Falsarthrobacter nasiphocae TaxID=189863 RepID=A0AAE3YHT0_9MICC|nr:DUF1345 domain-containing protein [Falsarthrobacter nasiphocae]MDR6892006.1 putative membrane protein [Falsarthrobacter nasiphocae]